MNANETILDAYVLRQILVEQLAATNSNLIKKEYKKILDDIISRLKDYDTLNLIDTNRLIKEIRDIISPDIQLATELQSLATSEAQFIATTVNTAAGMVILDKLPKNSTLLKIANAPLFEGHTLIDTFDMFDDRLKFDLAGQIRQAVIQGETIQQIKERVIKRFSIVDNQAEAIARTATSELVNRVRDEVYKENEDIFKGYMSQAVLDGRTTFLCASYDNKTWNIDKQPIGHNLPFKPVPRHVNCRSIILPITKSYKELGFNIEEISGLTRSSLDGAVPKDMTFNQWLNTKNKDFIEKYLGVSRAALFMEGKITIGDLISKSGKTRTLDELKA